MILKIKTKKIIILVGLVLGFGLAFFKLKSPAQPGRLDAFAQCLKQSGAVFYGAFWCPHCKSQKKMFGSSVKYIPYVECSTPDGKRQLQVCKDKKITGYPTWEFADGSRLSGEVPLEILADKTDCQL